MTLPSVTRRFFLAAGCSILGVQPASASARLGMRHDVAGWDHLVSVIAGPVEIAPALRVALLRDFTANFGNSATLELLWHFRKAGLASALDPQPGEIEDRLRWMALYLYTGSGDPSDHSAELVNYPFALGWKALSFAKPPGMCLGPAFGHWMSPPGGAQ